MVLLWSTFFSISPYFWVLYFCPGNQITLLRQCYISKLELMGTVEYEYESLLTSSMFIFQIIESHILILKIAELKLQSLLPLWCEAVLIYKSADFLLRTRWDEWLIFKTNVRERVCNRNISTEFVKVLLRNRAVRGLLIVWRVTCNIHLLQNYARFVYIWHPPTSSPS